MGLQYSLSSDIILTWKRRIQNCPHWLKRLIIVVLLLAVSILSKADIADELEKLSRLETEFDKIKDNLGLSERQVEYYDRGAIGYLLHN